MKRARGGSGLFERRGGGLRGVAVVCLMVLLTPASKGIYWESDSLPQQKKTQIEGTVRTAEGSVVSGATVTIVLTRTLEQLRAKTKEDGGFSFTGIAAGAYNVRAEKLELGEGVVVGVAVVEGERKRVELVLKKNAATSESREARMEFSDAPSFTIAGVTDWSNVGLHGSGSEVRTGEALARETVGLKTGPGEKSGGGNAAKEEESLRAAFAREPGSFEANHRLGEFYCRRGKYAEAIPLLEAAEKMDAGNSENSQELGLAYAGSGDSERARQQIEKLAGGQSSGERHRMAGEIYERLGDPTDAAREFERATQMDSSEENYFALGSEFLAHHAEQQAVEIFGSGARLHPESSRMLNGLGAAQYGTRAYEDAAKTLCKAADLKPQDATAYIFLGRIERASTETFPCSEERLARFAHDQPEDTLANYYYGLILWKRAKAADDAEKMRRAEALIGKCIVLDPKMDAAYLQMGIMDAERGQFAKSVQSYKKAIEMNGKLGEAHFRLGQLYKRLGDDSNAQKELQTYKQIEKDEEAEREKEARGQLQLVVTPNGKPAESAPK